MSNRRLVPIAMTALVHVIACGSAGGITAPVTPTTVVITVRTSGVAVDPDGYTVLNRHLQPNDSVTLRGTFGASLRFELTDVANTCRVDAPNPRDVAIAQYAITRVHFEVRCATLGAVRVDALVVGLNDPPFEYRILDGGEPVGVLRADRPALVTGLFPGATRLVLDYQAGFCDLAEPASHEIQVASDDTLRLSVVVHCPTTPDTAYAVLVYRDRMLELLTERGTRSLMLTPPGVAVFSPVWSPDGGRIAFISNLGADQEMHVMRWDGSGMVKLADVTGLTGLRWSPDGRTITAPLEYDGRVRLIRADGSGELVLALGWNPTSVSWSPDSRRFVTDRNGDIVIVDSETGSVHPITNDGGEAGAIETVPSWSPRGDRIVWLSDRGVPVQRCSSIGGCFSPTMRLWSSDGEGRSPRQARPELVGYGGVWSPRGALLALGGGLFDGLRWVYDPVAETMTRIDPSLPGFGSWLPDERHIVYTREGAVSPNFEIVTDRFDGGDLRVIATRRSDTGVSGPIASWRPTRP